MAQLQKLAQLQSEEAIHQSTLKMVFQTHAMSLHQNHMRQQTQHMEQEPAQIMVM